MLEKIFKIPNSFSRDDKSEKMPEIVKDIIDGKCKIIHNSIRQNSDPSNEGSNTTIKYYKLEYLDESSNDPKKEGAITLNITNPTNSKEKKSKITIEIDWKGQKIILDNLKNEKEVRFISREILNQI